MTEDKRYQLHLGDCLEVMKQIPDGSVDMVLCDLPYGTTACKWDSIVPLPELWTEYIRITKSYSNIILFGSEPFSSLVRTSNLTMYKYDWVWQKNRPTGFQHAKNMPLKAHENILVFSKGSMGHGNLLKEKRMTYNPQGIEHCGKQWRASVSKFGTIVGKRPSHKDNGVQEFTGYPTSILVFPKDETHCHPTQKPVALCEYLVKTYTNEGELVLDNCMGSGTTGVACVNTNRRFIGIEREQKYYEVAQKRIDEVLNTPRQEELF